LFGNVDALPSQAILDQYGNQVIELIRTFFLVGKKYQKKNYVSMKFFTQYLGFGWEAFYSVNRVGGKDGGERWDVGSKTTFPADELGKEGELERPKKRCMIIRKKSNLNRRD
jgi:hypothetical protein